MSNKVAFWVKKNSPELLLASGIINSAAAIILACFATKKLDTVLQPSNKKIVEIHTKMDAKEISIEEGRKQLAKTYAKTAVGVGALYAPSVLAYGLSVASMVGSHNILQGRNLALAATVTTLKNSFDAYRGRVRDKLGEAKEKAIFEKNEKTLTEAEKKTVTDMKNYKTNAVDPFRVFWGVGNPGFDVTHPELNCHRLLQIEQFANTKLQSKGYLFLDEIYEDLGITAEYAGEELFKAAHIIGWIYDPNDKTRDNYVSFGIHLPNGELTPELKQLNNGKEDLILLNFNCDGDILTGDGGKKCFSKAAMERYH